MPKIEVNQVAEILKRNKADAALLRAIIEEMNLVVRAESNEDKAPATKKQHVIVISDPEGRIPKDAFAGWVVQIPDSESPCTTLDRIHRACYEYNASKKGRLLLVRRIGEALECVPAKTFKEVEVWVKTRTPVLVVVTDNVLPRMPATPDTAAPSADADLEDCE